MAIYETIMEKAHEKNTNIAQIERDLDLPRGSIYKYNDHVPGVDKVKKIADFLGCSIEDLLIEKEADGEIP